MHHVYAHAVDRRALFFDDGDCQVYLVILRGVVAVYGWRVLAHCLMTNHVHLVVETPYPTLSKGMQHFHGHYGAHVNRRHALRGHVFHQRFGSTRVKDDRQLQAVLAYVEANPVEAGLCREPADWRRSSAATADAHDVVDRARLAELSRGEFLAEAT